jgi:predicted Zn-dependent protease
MPNSKKSKGRAKDAPVGGEFRGQDTEAFDIALKEYEGALEMMRKGAFAEARERLLALAAENRNEPVLSDRARTWAGACAKRIATEAPTPRTAEERYHEGVAKLNEGRPKEAMAMLDAAVAAEPGEASYWYARAAAHGGLRDAEAAAADLRRAIALVPHLRFQAAQDSAFEPVRDEASFIDVIEPSAAGA